MRRPHVYQRSATRAALLRGAEAAGAIVLARSLGQALTEAEGIVRRAP